MKSFITKGILPLLLLGTITWLGQYIFIVDGSIDWFRFMLVYGVPIGIPYMFIIIPSRWDLSGTVGMAAMSVIIGAVFGFIVAIGIAVRAVWYTDENGKRHECEFWGTEEYNQDMYIIESINLRENGQLVKRAIIIKKEKEDYIMAELSEAEIVFKIFAEKHK